MISLIESVTQAAQDTLGSCIIHVVLLAWQDLIEYNCFLVVIYYIMRMNVELLVNLGRMDADIITSTA